MLVANACFDPETAAEVWKHLPSPGSENNDVAEFYSTHPHNPHRYEQIISSGAICPCRVEGE